LCLLLRHDCSEHADVYARQDLENDELKALTRQVGSHMESMRANLQQVDGLVPQLVRSRAALQALLFRHLDPDRYEQAVLG